MPADSTGDHRLHSLSLSLSLSLEIQGREDGAVVQIECAKAREIIQLGSEGGSIDMG